MDDAIMDDAPSWSTGYRSRDRIADAVRADWLTTHGSLVAIDIIAVGPTTAYRCVLDDGSGRLDLLFLGRRRVAGLTIGTYCEISGRVTHHSGRLAMWNPRYRLEPGPATRQDRS